MANKPNVTKAQLVEAYNTIAEEPVKTFKTVKVGLAAVQAVINEYDETDIGSIPEDTRNILVEAGVEMPEPASKEEADKPKRKRGDWLSHCHERVYQAMVDADNKPMTKLEIAELAITTEAVVSNAFYDFRRGTHTPEGLDKVAVNLSRADGKVLYSLDLGDPEEDAEADELQEALLS